MSAESIGLWLVGIGSLPLIGAIIAAPPGAKGLIFATTSTSRERLIFAAKLNGTILVAAGSLVVAVSQLPAWWLIVATFVFTAVCADVAMAWLAKRHRDDQLAQAQELAKAGGEAADPLTRRRLRLARQHATWRWCLLHPLNTEPWPGLESRADRRDHLDGRGRLETSRS